MKNSVKGSYNHYDGTILQSSVQDLIMMEKRKSKNPSIEPVTVIGFKTLPNDQYTQPNNEYSVPCFVHGAPVSMEPKSYLKELQHELSVQDVSYTVQVWQGSWWKGCCLRQRHQKSVLSKVTAHMQSGQLTAILGNSGSGKTSLLDFIACRLNGNGKNLKGSVELDGENLTEGLFRKKAGYVIQADRLMANLTVRETLTYTAVLQAANKGNGEGPRVKERVNVVLEDLGLRHVASALVGGYIVRGISGGERRRVSIGIQLLQDPDLLLLDEPTTGLDSFTAHYLVATLSELAQRKNKIILMTIHQPRSDIFQLFDQIGILCQGEVIYFGPRDQLVPHFTSLGYPCPTYANPLDHYVDLASIDRRDASVETACAQRLSELQQHYKTSAIYHSIRQAVSTCTGPPTLTHGHVQRRGCTKPMCTWFIRFWKLLFVLLQRMYLNLWRDRMGFIMRLVQTPIFAFFIWIFLWRLNKNISTAVQDRSGIIYQMMSVPAMVGVLSAAALFPCLRDLYFREAREGQYSSHHMLIAYFIHILPFTLLSTMGFAVWLHWGVGLYPETHRFAIMWGVVIVQQYLGELMTVGCLGIFHGVPLAQATATLLVSACVLIASGFLRSLDGMLDILKWVGYAMNYKWSSEILNANEFHQMVFDCDQDNELACELFTGDDYLDLMFPGAVANMGRNAGILAAYVVGTCILVCLVFRIRGIKQLN